MIDKKTAKVLVIGAGIIGMTTAYHLHKAGYQNINIISKHDPLNTNSDAAAALLRPYDAKPQEDANAWSKKSYSEFFNIYYNYLKEKARYPTQHIDSPGITFVTDVEYFGPEAAVKPQWMKDVDQLLEEKIAQLEKDTQSKEEYVQKAAIELLNILKEQKAKLPITLKSAKLHSSRPEVYASIVPLIDSTIYRKWLLQQYEKSNKKYVHVKPEGIESLEVESESLKKLAKEYDIIINCTGEQARYLTTEAQTKSIRGLVVISEIPEKLNYCIGVEPNPNLDNGKIKISYAIIRPESKTCVLGGTYEEVDKSILSNEEKKQKDINNILDGIVPLIPGIKDKNDLKIIETREAFRNGRFEMNKEVKVIKVHNKQIIIAHPLGHGGGGFSLSHGVGEDITNKCTNLLPTLNEKNHLSQENIQSNRPRMK